MRFWIFRRMAHGAIATVALLACGAVAVAADEPIPDIVQFNRDIRPILSDTCFQCHGPDQAQRKADLRLDLEAEAFAARDGGPALTPNQPDLSQLYRRIASTDEQERMPPADSNRHLTPRQIELIRRWIEQGAVWQKHWSLLPPIDAPPPAAPDAAWLRNPVDAFVLARLQREGLSPSVEADRVTLIRRVTLDLTGLPPTPAEVDAFLADPAPDAYERLVDRLLASPRYGERMATRWLDAARYADTNGYQNDGERHMWRWRDWVIAAYNGNMPFDQFTIEQLAGDLLAGATLDQQIATGFNRNHRGNAEGGIIPEEYQVEYVVDRVDTTATVWLGLTMGCARCHDHKFDPIAQREYYQVFAHFNNVPEKGRAVKFGNSPPMIKSPTPDQQQILAELEQRLAAAQAEFDGLAGSLPAEQAAWEPQFAANGGPEWSVAHGLLAHWPLDGDTDEKLGAAAKAALAAANKPGAVAGAGGASGTVLPSPPVAFGAGRLGQAAAIEGQSYVNGGNVGDYGFDDAFSLSAWIYPRGGQGGAIVSRMTPAEEGDGYSLSLVGGKLQGAFVKRWLDDALRVETADAIASDCWTHVLLTYDGTRLASGVGIYINGQPAPLSVLLDELNQSFTTTEPLRIGAGGGPESFFQGSIDDVRVFNRALAPNEAQIVAAAETVLEIARMPPAERSPAQAGKLAACFLAEYAPQPVREARQKLLALEAQRTALVASFPTTMVMQEMSTPRVTSVLLRGEYDKPGEPVSPGVPASLGSLPDGAPQNRLGLAQWLTDPAHPLTARVAVNRFWQAYFGSGLVKTVDDFGSQGQWPSHPELLDWLAVHFVNSGWDIKAMQRLLVTSATYRQSSRLTPALQQLDPENRLLARGPRMRLSAEMIRDQALFASGLLVERVGGPSVMPYQPAGLWKELATGEYAQDKGENLYRRSMYTFWKRTIAPPAMLTFDASGRETCIVRETRTNTPLQALTLLNDITFVEASRLLAERVLREAADAPARLTLAFRLTTGRAPAPRELEILQAGWQEHLAHFQKDPEAALALLAVGEHPRDPQLDPSELAAYATVASLIMNLDETITKE